MIRVINNSNKGFNFLGAGGVESGHIEGRDFSRLIKRTRDVVDSNGELSEQFLASSSYLGSFGDDSLSPSNFGCKRFAPGSDRFQSSIREICDENEIVSRNGKYEQNNNSNNSNNNATCSLKSTVPSFEKMALPSQYFPNSSNSISHSSVFSRNNSSTLSQTIKRSYDDRETASSTLSSCAEFGSNCKSLEKSSNSSEAERHMNSFVVCSSKSSKNRPIIIVPSVHNTKHKNSNIESNSIVSLSNKNVRIGGEIKDEQSVNIYEMSKFAGALGPHDVTQLIGSLGKFTVRKYEDNEGVIYALSRDSNNCLALIVYNNEISEQLKRSVLKNDRFALNSIDDGYYTRGNNYEEYDAFVTLPKNEEWYSGDNFDMDPDNSYKVYYEEYYVDDECDNNNEYANYHYDADFEYVDDAYESTNASAYPNVEYSSTPHSTSRFSSSSCNSSFPSGSFSFGSFSHHDDSMVE